MRSKSGDSDTRSRWLALAMFVAVAVVLYAVVALAFSRCAHYYSFGDDANHPRPDPRYHGPRLLAGWVRFDGLWYRSIAERGYFFHGARAQSSVAFFPLYPMLIRGVHGLFGGDVAAWGIPITFVSGAVAVSLYWRWVHRHVQEHARVTALAVLALWPYALYLYGAVYADALFLALVLAAFTCVERDRIVPAALFGALATATRPVGLAVVIGLAARVIEQRGVIQLAVPARMRALALSSIGGRDRFAPTEPSELSEPSAAPRGSAARTLRVHLRRMRATDARILFSAAGLVGYSVYLHRRFGDAFAYATAEGAPGWDQAPGWRVWLKHAWFTRLVHLPGSGLRYFGVATLQGVLAVGLVLLVPRIVRRFGWAYGVYTLVLLAIPLLGSKDFQGLGRYALGAFPAFGAAGELLADRPRVRRIWLTLSAGALVVFCASFARNAYIA